MALLTHLRVPGVQTLLDEVSKSGRFEFYPPGLLGACFLEIGDPEGGALIMKDPGFQHLNLLACARSDDPKIRNLSAQLYWKELGQYGHLHARRLHVATQGIEEGWSESTRAILNKAKSEAEAIDRQVWRSETGILLADRLAHELILKRHRRSVVLPDRFDLTDQLVDILTRPVGDRQTAELGRRIDIIGRLDPVFE